MHTRQSRFLNVLSLLTLHFVNIVSASPIDYDDDLDRGASGSYPVLDFVTTSLKAPRVNWLKREAECDDGLRYFLTPKGWKVPSPGPMILDNDGSLIWTHHFDNAFGGQAYDLRSQMYKGESFLTFWLGDDRIKGHGFGQYYMLNSSYDIVRTVSAGNAVPADLHEFLITPQGTALICFFVVAPGDLRYLGRKSSWNQFIWDSVFQELNIETGEVTFEWRASEHITVNSTFRKKGSFTQGSQEDPLDWFHLNSIEKDELGNYLVSARYTHAIYYIDGRTKDIIWTLGGKNNDFADLSGGYALNFAWQHDARFHSPSAFTEIYKTPKIKAGTTTRLLTLFDNSDEDHDRVYHYGASYSRGLLLEVTYPTQGSRRGHEQSDDRTASLDKALPENPLRQSLSSEDDEKIRNINKPYSPFTVRVIQEFINPDTHLHSLSQGSLQVLPASEDAKTNSKILVGYGLAAAVSEYSSAGSLLCDFHFGSRSSWETGDAQSYRAFKSPWVGQPKTPPMITLKKNKMYVSWNGATEVKQWLLQAATVDPAKHTHASGSTASWSELVNIPKTGFETAIAIPQEALATSRYFRVMAVDANGRVCEHGISDMLDKGYIDTAISRHVGSHWVGSIKVIFVMAGVLVLYSFTRGSRRKGGRRDQRGILMKHAIE